ncbi:MAG TPA: GatB/YqeY domain-containing protein [Hyphomicrobiaceae bacterium]|nr:GatB/YqeY domain-containing protein [Hyphomicrobiaceae bacterium]
MRERINEATKAAMKAGDKQRLSTLRLMNAAIKDRDIAGRVDSSGQSTGRERVDDAEILQLLQKMIKQRRESEATYRQAGRVDLADQEASEIIVIEEFMPAQMAEDQVKAAVAGIVDELGASGLKDMGRTMAALKERYAGQMDFGKASGFVKSALS